MLQKLGARTVSHPVIRIEPIDSPQVASAMASLADYSIITVLSRNAARFLTGQKVPIPPDTRIAAIGAGTSAELEAGGLKVAFCPPAANSESLGKKLVQAFRQQQDSRPVLILRADRGSDELAGILNRAEIPFQQFAVYRSIDVASPKPEVVQLVENGQVHWITLTSSAIARSAMHLFGDQVRAGKLKAVSISPQTSAAARAAGFDIAATAGQAGLEGLVQALIDAVAAAGSA